MPNNQNTDNVGTMIDLTALRDALRAHLKDSPLSQMQIAREIGINQSWISSFVSGRIKSPRIDRLARIAQWVESDKNKAKDRHAA